MKQNTNKGSGGWWDVGWWGLLSVMALAFAIGVAHSIPAAYEAAFGRAAALGTFVPERSECRVECTFYGTFTFTDGRTQPRFARMHEPFISLHQGEAVPAVWPQSESSEVFLAHGSRLWLEWSALLVGALAVMVVALSKLPRLVRDATSSR